MKSIRKIVALATGATMVGATIMGAMAADLSAYPQPFVKDCMFSGAIVVGANAASEDVVGAVDVGTALAISSTTSTSSGSSGSVAVEGDSWKVATSSKVLELKDPIANITSYISDGDLNALADGTFANNKGSFPYEQELRFGPMVADNYEDDDDNVGDMLYIASGVNFINYTLDFTTSVESDVDTDTVKTLKDIRNKKISLLGKEYSVVKATNSSGVELRLMGGAVNDILGQGETKTYTIDGKEYEVELTYVGTADCKFKVNGETTDLMAESDSDTVGGIELGIKDIMEEEAGEVQPDQVEFYLGASKLIFKDTSISDTVTSYKLKVGDEEMDDVAVIMTGTAGASTTKIDNIKLVYTADDDFYLQSGDKVSDKMEEPQGLINFDISYEGMTTEETEQIDAVPSGDKRYDLKFEVASGEVTLPIAWNQDTTAMLVMGDNNYNITPIPHSAILKNQYFVLTPAAWGAATASTETQVVQYKGADKGSSSSPKIKIKNLATGETMEKSTTNVTGIADQEATFKMGGTDYMFRNASNVDTDDYSIKLTSPTTLAYFAYNNSNTSRSLYQASNVTWSELGSTGFQIVTNKGALISVMNNQTNASRNAGMTVNVTEVEPANMLDGGAANSNTIRLTLAGSASTADRLDTFTYAAGPTKRQTKEDNDVEIAWTLYGAKIVFSDETSAPDKFEIEWPKAQRTPQVFVSSGEVKATQVGGAGELVCKVDVPSAKLDTEVADVTAMNLIIVGGPCINSAAAQVLGVEQTFPACAAGFAEGKAKIKLVSSGSSTALVVAGYSAMDTRRATRVLKNFNDYDLTGDEVEVTGTSLTDISVSAPTQTE